MQLKNIWGSNSKENFFRKKLILLAEPKTAYARIYVDTGYELYINGRFVACVDEWCNTRDYNVRLFLKKGVNQIAIHAINHGGHRGLAFELAVNGESLVFSDESWLMCPEEKWGWILEDYCDSMWTPADVLDMRAAGTPQWQTRPGSNPETVIPTLDCSQFFMGDIPKSCASPYWTAKKPDWKPAAEVTELLGDEYTTFVSKAHLPEIQSYRAILQDDAREEKGHVLIETTSRWNGPSFIVDFGGETVGFFRMKIQSAESFSYRLFYGETLDEAMSEPSRDLALNRMLHEEYRVFSGTHEVESRMRVAFRYVRVEIYDSEAPVNVSGFSVRTALYPIARRGFFSCNDRELTQLWQMGERTLHFCMQEYYLDAPKRDRFMWTGDTRMQALINYYTFMDQDLFKFCWEELARTQYQNGGITSAYGEGCSMLWDYVAWYVIAFYDYYLYTGENGFALKHRESLNRAVDYLSSLTDESGLIIVPENPLGRLWMVELNQYVGYDPFLNELYLRSLKVAALFSKLANDIESLEKYQKRAEAIEEKVQSLLANGSMYKAFETTGHVTLQYELAEMKLNSDNAAAMLKRLRTYWRGMIASGSDCLHEGTSNGDVQRIDEHLTDHPSYISYCHAWTGAATVLLPMGIAGIRPLEAGFKKVIIKPQTSSLDDIKCVVPTPYGDIAVKIIKNKIFYHLPEGIEGVLVAKGREMLIYGNGERELN